MMGKVIWIAEYRASHPKPAQLCPMCLFPCWLRIIGWCR